MPNWKKVIISGSDAALNSLVVNNNVSANAFITDGGVSTDFVKGDGSLDSSTYLTSTDLSGYVDTSGTPANNQLAIFTDVDTIEGTTALTYNGTTLTINPGFLDNSIITANTTGTVRVFGTTEIQVESDLEVNIGSTTLDYITVSPSEGVIKFPQLGNGFVKQTGGELTIDSSTYSTQTLTLGTDNQIPFMNGTTNFEYSPALTYNDNATNPQLTVDGTTTSQLSLDSSTESFTLKTDNTAETFSLRDEGFTGEPFFVYDKSGGDMLIKIGDSTSFSFDAHIEIDNANTTVAINNSSLDIGTIANATTDTDKYLVSDSGTVKFRTGLELWNDISTLVETATGGTGTEDGANTWAKLATYNITSNFAGASFIYSITNEEATYAGNAIIHLKIRRGASSAAGDTQVFIDYLAGGFSNSILLDDSFKIVYTDSTDIQLWMKKGSTFNDFKVHLLGENTEGVTITYETNPAWQSTTPTGTGGSAQSDGLKFGSATVWTSDNDGAGSGLDADTLDGINSGDFVRRTIAQTITGTHSYEATQVITDSNRIDFGTGNDVRFIFGGTNLTTDIYNNAEWQVRRDGTDILTRLDSDTGHLQIGAGEGSAACRLHIVDEDTIVGGTAGNSEEYRRLQFRGGSGGNDFKIQEWGLRDATGTSWTTMRYHNSIGIDGSFQTPGTNTRTFWERDPNAGFQYFGNGANYTLTIDGTNGRVGVGTEDPDTDLEVSSTTGGIIRLTSSDTSVAIGESIGRLEFKSNDASAGGDNIMGFVDCLATNAGTTYALTFGTGLAAAATEKMRIDEDGNVGIGTDSPDSKLHIDGGTNSEVLKIEADSDPYIRWVENSINVGFLQFTGDEAYLSNQRNGTFFFRTNDTNKMVITGDGNVGIGTTTPFKNLDVQWSSSNVNPETGEGLSGGTSGKGVLLRNSNTTVNTFANLDFRANTVDARIAVTNNATNNGDFHFILDNTTGTPQTRLLIQGETGNVAIGVTDPEAKVELKQSVGSVALNILNGNEDTFRLSTTVENTAINTVVFRQGLYYNSTENTSIAYYRGGSTIGGFMTFQTNNGSERMRIDKDGNVGIGTDDPESLLHVEAADGVIGEIVIKGGNNTVTSAGEINSQLLFASNDASPAGAEDIGSKITQVTENTLGSRVGMGFFTYGPTGLLERMRIDADGNVGIGEVSPDSILHTYENSTSSDSTAGVTIEQDGTGDAVLHFILTGASTWTIGADNSASDNFRIANQDSLDTWEMDLDSSGNVEFAGTSTATNFILSSDRRLKTDIEDINPTKIKTNWKTFKLKSDENQLRYGVIAQELEEEHPEFVRTNDKGFKSVAYVDLLVAKNAELEERVNKLEQLIHKLSK